jgi:arylsulfatase A-like enzyme/Tfp pilus assembly protein PilF
LVTVDTTRADHLEPYGAPVGTTPTLARLATEGVVFERAYSVAPITLVAHTSILTGRYPPEHRVRNNGIHSVPEEVATLAEALGERGYRTGAFVSAAVLEARYNLDQGFEVYDDDLSAGRQRHPRMVPDRPANAAVDAAFQWLDGVGEEEPFFLWVHFYDPHAPYSPPPPFRDEYRQDLYRGEIAFLDAELGRLLRHPRVAADGVAVTVLGDHGESLGEHGEQTHAILAYDATLHVPWILRLPRGGSGGSGDTGGSGGPRGLRIPVPVSQVDLVPTVLDLLGLPPDALGEGLPGRSLLPYLEGTSPREEMPRGLYSETYLPFYTYGWAKLKVWRQGWWKYIEAPTPELYDLRRDPRELSNVFDQNPGLAHDLPRDLREQLAALGGDAEGEAALALDSEAREKLRSLGYLAAGSKPPTAADGERGDPKALVGLHTGLEKARFLMRDGLHELAARELRRLLTQDPDNLAALTDLASALEAAGQTEEAIRAVERALALDPAYARLHGQLASLEAARGAVGKALGLLDGALELDPRMEGAIIDKARLLMRLERAEEARQVLDDGLALLPEEPLLEAVHAQMVELRRGDLDGAEARLDRALARDPFLVLAWRLKAQVAEGRGEWATARKYLEEGLKRRPDDAALHGILGSLLARGVAGGGGAEVEAHLREAIRLSPTLVAEYHVSLGGWLAEHGRVEEALAEYARVLERYPVHPGARNNRAIALYRSGRLEEAQAELQALIRQAPGLADPHNNLAAIAVERGDWPTVERHARRSVQLDPTKAPPWNNLGLAHEQQGRGDEARGAYHQALELDPLYWPARLNLGLLESAAGHGDEAEEQLLRVVTEVPTQADAHLALGDLYAAAEDTESARRHYNAFLRHAPGHPAAAEVRGRLAALPPQ